MLVETPHMKADKDKFAKTVIMPGDPLRAKFIAETYLDNYELLNEVRGMLCYTGYYEGIKVTVMGSGMGMPSMGIYCYELYNFFDVERIIRIGSAGAYVSDLDLFDIVLSTGSYTEGNFAMAFNHSDSHFVEASKSLNEIIEKVATNNALKLIKGNTNCGEAFDPYIPNSDKVIERMPKKLNIIAAEMEAFALFYIARYLNKEAACLMTVADTPFKEVNATSEQRQFSLTRMIELALNVVKEIGE